ncbi:heme exporter protein CcmD [Pseudophaeobacter flagellatus]|uniref:heme exporter protein CcmD n=1 Tax=Pseudophaeobacter flagellatus TaxID=2899119 RepID=UPI001E53FD1D|nr:heme exporter protein CcmD [Pseudophaeobacter flagellatus]MCD9147629.1 heme exporter protein CcmD [Pseudophaeobacter flagellatus]
MWPELGKYGETVLSAYAASLLLLGLLVALTLWRGRRVRRMMEDLEQRMRRDG